MGIVLEWIRAAAPVVAALLLPFWLVRSGVRWLLDHWADRERARWGWAAALANLALAVVVGHEAHQLGDLFWWACAAVPAGVAVLCGTRLLTPRGRDTRPSWRPPAPGDGDSAGQARSSTSFASVSIRFD